MANRANTGARASLADNTSLNLASKPSGIERSDGGDQNIKKLLNSLPTKDDIQELMCKWLGPLKVD